MTTIQNRAHRHLRITGALWFYGAVTLIFALYFFFLQDPFHFLRHAPSISPKLVGGLLIWGAVGMFGMLDTIDALKRYIRELEQSLEERS